MSNEKGFSKMNTEFKLFVEEREGNFAQLALLAFDQTNRQIFTQALVEIQRMQKVNETLAKLESKILDPASCDKMDIGQQIAFAKILGESNQSSMRALLEFGKLFKDIRSTVSFHENLQSSPAARAVLRGDSPKRLPPNKLPEETKVFLKKD